MVVIRPVIPADLDRLLELANLAGVGLTTRERRLLAEAAAAPATQADLAARFGVTQSAIAHRWRSIRRKLCRAGHRPHAAVGGRTH